MGRFNANRFGQAAGYNVHLQNWFEVSVEGYPNLIFAAQSIPLPTEGNETVEVHYANSKVYQAGKATFEAGSFTFMDVLGLKTCNDLADWRKKVYDPDSGRIGWVTDYKKSITVTLYGPDGVAVSKWKLHGAWPSNVNWGQLDYNSSDKRSVEVTLTYDWGQKVA
jgi:hypothetical protein